MSRAWREVAAEMLAGRELGSKVSRFEAWRRACQTIANLEAQVAKERDIFRKALDPDNEPGFVGLWVDLEQENERLRPVRDAAAAYVESEEAGKMHESYQALVQALANVVRAEAES